MQHPPWFLLYCSVQEGSTHLHIFYSRRIQVNPRALLLQYHQPIQPITLQNLINLKQQSQDTHSNTVTGLGSSDPLYQSSFIHCQISILTSPSTDTNLNINPYPSKSLILSIISSIQLSISIQALSYHPTRQPNFLIPAFPVYIMKTKTFQSYPRLCISLPLRS